MTTRAYVHSPIPPFTRIAGPLAVSSVRRQIGLSVDSRADISLAIEDVDLDWLRTGMCWSLDQSDIGEPVWGGFVEVEEYPMDSDEVEIALIGPKLGLLSVEMAVKLPLPVSSANAVRQALLSVQSRNGGIFPGIIEQIGPAVLLDVRAETVSDFINTIRETVSADWYERTIVKENELEFYLDFGLLQNHTNIVLGRNEITEGRYRRERPVASITVLGEGSGFNDREIATVAGGSRQSAAEPAKGSIFPQNERVAELLSERDIGPAATRHAIEISERVSSDGVANLAMERYEDLLHDVEEIVFTLDATKSQAQRVKVGDVIRINIPNWFKNMSINAQVHIREISPDDERGEKDIIASVVW